MFQCTIEIMGAYCPKTTAFFKELGKKIAQETGEWMRASSHLIQNLSAAIQKGNAASVANGNLFIRMTFGLQCILGYPNPFGLEVVPKCSDK